MNIVENVSVHLLKKTDPEEYDLVKKADATPCDLNDIWAQLWTVVQSSSHHKIENTSTCGHPPR